MPYERIAVDTPALPAPLREHARPPRTLHIAGMEGAWEQFLKRPRVAVVGTRNISPYGRRVTGQLVTELAARGIVIISGLAYGVDIHAHRSALDAGGMTAAVLPGPLDNVAPRNHAADAKRLLASGGLLISEYSPGEPIKRHNFVERNRIVSGLADALLITEATEDSGTMHTVTFALDQGIEVLCVPGPITSPTSAGTNNLLKTGARPVTCSRDILQALHLPEHQLSHQRTTHSLAANKSEQLIIDLMEQGVTAADEIRQLSGLSVERFGQYMTMLEITARIRPLGADNWAPA